MRNFIDFILNWSRLCPPTHSNFWNFIYRFPCTVLNCKKEYRTQWELNSHNRLKHSKPESTSEQDIEYTVQIEYNTSNDKTSDFVHASTFMHQIKSEEMYKQTAIESDLKEVSVAKRKNRNNNQQIIYVMPGPDQWLKIKKI